LKSSYPFKQNVFFYDDSLSWKIVEEGYMSFKLTTADKLHQEIFNWVKDKYKF